jgi:hypothetical protein
MTAQGIVRTNALITEQDIKARELAMSPEARARLQSTSDMAHLMLTEQAMQRDE